MCGLLRAVVVTAEGKMDLQYLSSTLEMKEFVTEGAAQCFEGVLHWVVVTVYQ